MMTLYQPDLLYADGRFLAQTGLLVADDGVIVGILPNTEPPPVGCEIIRLAGKAVLPGFANTHSHSFQRLIRGKTESRRSNGRDFWDFWSWRGAMYHAAASLEPEDVYHVARITFLEMALAGTTTVGEFHYLHRRPNGKSYDDPNLLARRVIAAAESVGIRIALLRAAYQRPGYGLPSDPGQARFLETTDEFVANTENLHREYRSGGAWIGVAPHSVRAVPLDALTEIVGWARQHSLPVHMHVSEQSAEVAACQEEYGATPVRLLAQHKLLGSDFTAVHAIHIDADEMDLLAASGATICSCPTTERNLGDGIVLARAVMERGIPVAFGSDSQAQIDSLEDARELDYHLRLQQQQRAVLDQIDGEEMSTRLFQCATKNGAEALNSSSALSQKSGMLQHGNAADFFTVDLADPSIAGSEPETLLPLIVFGLQRTAIADVVVGGRFVIRDHTHPAQQEILTQYQEVYRKVWRAPHLAMQ
ncbi:MAG TPA: formimidoylglutamate deiminase [Acidobacteriaceae bacterium]|nr:formimidoylglutamate deiminase [Acidobacteriaceae bacterium]